MAATERQHSKTAAAATAARADDGEGRSPRFGGMFRLFDASRRPDKTWEGFKAAAKAAIEVGEQTDWISADDMCERIEHEMAVRLRLKPVERGDIYTGLHINFVGSHRKTRVPQYRIETDWGWRIDVAGLISFSMAKPLTR